jgi:hypothetical protein
MSKASANNQTGEEGSVAFAKAFHNVKIIFDDLGAKHRLELLKSLGGLYGHRILPGIGGGPSGPAQTVKSAPAAKQHQPKSQKSAEQLEVQRQISRCNREISSISKETGARLPENHPLLLERSRLFRDFRGKTSFGTSVQSTEAQRAASLGSASGKGSTQTAKGKSA